MVDQIKEFLDKEVDKLRQKMQMELEKQKDIQTQNIEPILNNIKEKLKNNINVAIDKTFSSIGKIERAPRGSYIKTIAPLLIEMLDNNKDDIYTLSEISQSEVCKSIPYSTTMTIAQSLVKQNKLQEVVFDKNSDIVESRISSGLLDPRAVRNQKVRFYASINFDKELFEQRFFQKQKENRIDLSDKIRVIE